MYSQLHCILLTYYLLSNQNEKYQISDLFIYSLSKFYYFFNSVVLYSMFDYIKICMVLQFILCRVVRVMLRISGSKLLFVELIERED